MIVQDIINAVSIDTRQVLTNSGNDAFVILNWVDRVHKDVLHTTLYANQNLATTSFTTTVGQTNYTLTPTTAIRRIVSIYDSTFNMSLTPADIDLDSPSPVQTRVNEEAGRPSAAINQPQPYAAYHFGGTSEYYRFIAPATLLVRPAPSTTAFVSTLNIVYEQLISTLSSLSAPLIVPDDGKDIVVAGVNWMAMAYIGKSQEAASWFQLYQQLKQGNRTGVLR
jgi:hypothetical protein